MGKRRNNNGELIMRPKTSDKLRKETWKKSMDKGYKDSEEDTTQPSEFKMRAKNNHENFSVDFCEGIDTTDLSDVDFLN